MSSGSPANRVEILRSSLYFWLLTLSYSAINLSKVRVHSRRDVPSLYGGYLINAWAKARDLGRDAG